MTSVECSLKLILLVFVHRSKSRFAPQLQAILDAGNAKRARAEGYKQDVHGTYNALAKSVAESRDRTLALYGTAQEKTASDYSALKDQIAQNYAAAKSAGQEQSKS